MKSSTSSMVEEALRRAVYVYLLQNVSALSEALTEPWKALKGCFESQFPILICSSIGKGQRSPEVYPTVSEIFNQPSAVARPTDLPLLRLRHELHIDYRITRV